MQIHLINNSTITNDGTTISLGDLSIKQGASFNLTFLYSGDVSTWAIRGQIRDNFAEQDGDIIANFTFLPRVYDSDSELTSIVAVLKANVTADMPSTKYQGSGTFNNRNCYVYDIEIVDPNDSNNVFKVVETSYVQVKPEVTI